MFSLARITECKITPQRGWRGLLKCFWVEDGAVQLFGRRIESQLLHALTGTVRPNKGYKIGGREPLLFEGFDLRGGVGILRGQCALSARYSGIFSSYEKVAFGTTAGYNSEC